MEELITEKIAEAMKAAAAQVDADVDAEARTRFPRVEPRPEAVVCEAIKEALPGADDE